MLLKKKIQEKKDREKLESFKNTFLYNENSFLQRYVAKNLIKYHTKTTNPADILEIGCGTGNLTKLINETYPDSKLYVFDKSSSMINFCQKHLKNKNNFYFVADAEKKLFKKKFDLLFSNMTIQWLKNIEQSLLQILKSSQYVALSLPTKGTLKSWIDLYEKEGLQSPVLNFPTITMLNEIFQKNTKNYEIKTETIIQYFNNSIDFIRHFKKIGSYYSSYNKKNTLYKIIKKYPDSIDITYQISYCFAATE